MARANIRAAEGSGSPIVTDGQELVDLIGRLAKVAPSKLADLTRAVRCIVDAQELLYSDPDLGLGRVDYWHTENVGAA